jgi:Zn ribbon nucleic-acid-binding protein
MSRLFIVRCPACGCDQKMRIYSKIPANHRRVCVYCGKKFNIHKDITCSRIVREIL